MAQCNMCPEVFEVMRPDESEAAPTLETEAVAVETPAAPLDPEDFVIETAEGLLETDTPAATFEEDTELLGEREITFDEPITSPEPALDETLVAEPELEVVPDPIEEEEPAPEPEAELAPEPEAELAPELEVELAPEPEVELAPEPEVELAPEPVPDAAPEVEEAPEEPDTPAVAPIQFGRRDPSDKARSLARSLVSDIIAYHKDKHTQSLEAGTLADDFDEEVQKSWKEYVDQVDADVVASSTFFNDALNEILAGGEAVFNLDG